MPASSTIDFTACDEAITTDTWPHHTPHSYPLHASVALVTGGGRGIGRIVACALADAGAAVAVVARSRDELAHTVDLIEGIP